MRTHTQIIESAGGYRLFAERLGQPANRVRFWRRRDAIPSEQWPAVVTAGLAVLDELDAANKLKKLAGQDASNTASRAA